MATNVPPIFLRNLKAEESAILWRWANAPLQRCGLICSLLNSASAVQKDNELSKLLPAKVTNARELEILVSNVAKNPVTRILERHEEIHFMPDFCVQLRNELLPLMTWLPGFGLMVVVYFHWK